MATWPEVQQYLQKNFKQNIAMQVIAGPSGFASEVDVGSGRSEIVIVLESGPLLQFVVFIASPNPIDVEKLLTTTQLFGIRKNKANNSYVMQHLAIMATLDAAEIDAPINLLADEARKVKDALGLH